MNAIGATPELQPLELPAPPQYRPRRTMRLLTPVECAVAQKCASNSFGMCIYETRARVNFFF